MTDNQAPGRQLLPIPDVRHVGLTTYDAKDPDTSFPPIMPLRPPAGAPNVLVILLDDAGSGSSPVSAFCRWTGPNQNGETLITLPRVMTQAHASGSFVPTPGEMEPTARHNLAEITNV